MAESNNLQPLSAVSTQAEDAQIKLNLVNRCIKAQQELAHKLRKESQRRKEICNFFRNSNLQLETEIRNADREIKSLLPAFESMKSANVELKKELLLSKENSLEINERMKNGEKKYEDLWLESKKRYESIPFVQDWLQATQRSETLNDNIDAFEIEAKILHKDIKTKKETLLELDRKQIVRWAEFFVLEMPINLKIIKEKSDEYSKLTLCIEANIKEKEMENKKTCLSPLITNVEVPPTSDHTKMLDDNWPNLSKNSTDSLIMPRLDLENTQTDVLNVKLELNKVVIHETAQVKTSNSVPEFAKNERSKTEENLNNEFLSSYFNKPVGLDAENGPRDMTKNYSKMKLINILEDIDLDENETYNIVAKVNPAKLQKINAIRADTSKTNNFVETSKTLACTTLESTEVEEIDLAKPSSANLLDPPSQFVDLTQESYVIRSTQQEVEVIVHLPMEDVPSKNILPQLKSSQENVKKRVSFDLPMTVEEVPTISVDIPQNETGETINSQLEEDTPLVTDDNFMKIKDMILKKHNVDDLDLSPQFVYAKKKAPQQINENEKVVTSKFFNQDKQVAPKTDEISLDQHDQTEAVVTEIDENAIDQPIIQNVESQPVITEDKASRSSKVIDSANPIAGLLFNHGQQGLPESLDISMSTTGFEDGDGDYPQCIDNSLLLSPKADFQPISSNNTEGNSQEVPNFLSGFRKTGLFFFGQSRQAEGNPESSAPNQEQKFNFKFGGQEKKTRGGLFNFFH